MTEKQETVTLMFNLANSELEGGSQLMIFLNNLYTEENFTIVVP